MIGYPVPSASAGGGGAVCAGIYKREDLVPGWNYQGGVLGRVVASQTHIHIEKLIENPRLLSRFRYLWIASGMWCTHQRCIRGVSREITRKIIEESPSRAGPRLLLEKMAVCRDVQRLRT